ncbi:MAG: LysR family transcriptional regulator [Nitratireductor sp.]
MANSKINLKQLEALKWVVDLGSFRKAAKHLNTTQPNISTRIAALETAIGSQIMLRNSGTIVLSPKGELILEQARKVLREVEQLAVIADRPELIEDRLRLGVTELVASTWLRTLLRQIKEAYPNLSIELTVDLSLSLDKELSSNALDLTIQNAPFSSKASGVEDLGVYEFIWIASKKVAKELGKQPTREKLLEQTILTHARHTQTYTDLTHYFGTKQTGKAKGAMFVPSSSLSSTILMAQDDMGIAAAPKAMVEEHLKKGSLVEVDFDWTPSPLRFAARYQLEKSSGYIAHIAKIAAKISSDFQAR